MFLAIAQSLVWSSPSPILILSYLSGWLVEVLRERSDPQHSGGVHTYGRRSAAGLVSRKSRSFLIHLLFYVIAVDVDWKKNRIISSFLSCMCTSFFADKPNTNSFQAFKTMCAVLQEYKKIHFHTRDSRIIDISKVEVSKSASFHVHSWGVPSLTFRNIQFLFI